MAGDLPRDLAAAGAVAAEFNMAQEVRKLIDEGYEVVDDPALTKKVKMLRPNGVVEDWDAVIEGTGLDTDKNFEYKVVLDESGVSEIMSGKPAIKLLRKSRT